MAVARGLMPFLETPFPPKECSWVFGVVLRMSLFILGLQTGRPPAGAQAPARLVYVVDIERFQHSGFPEPGLYDPEIQKSYYFVDTGLVAQNVYLAAASVGLGAWFHNCDKEAFEQAVGLGPDLRPVFGQTIGYASE